MERIKQFFNDQATDPKGDLAVRIEICIIVIYGLSLLTLLFGLIFAAVGGFLLPWGIYIGFIGWIILAFGFYAVLKQNVQFVLIFGILSVFLTLILVGFVIWAWVTCSKLWPISNEAGLGVVLLIMSLWSLAMAGIQGYISYLCYQLWIQIKGSDGAPPLEDGVPTEQY